MAEPTALDELVTSYFDFLLVRAPKVLAPFKQRLASEPEAAQAEVAVFSFLRQANLNPHPDEDPSLGGPDFTCHPKGATPFHVEVTALLTQTVATKSGIPAEGLHGSGAFSMITWSLLNEAINKAKQLEDKVGARVLAICTQHPWADVLCGVRAAAALMTGDTKIVVPIGDDAGATYSAVGLENSAFFRFDKGHIVVEPARQSISAILLFAVASHGSSVVGLLHPIPAVPFDPNLLPRVPFVKLKKWPVAEKLEGEWVNLEPRPAASYHLPITLTNAELKGA